MPQAPHTDSGQTGLAALGRPSSSRALGCLDLGRPLAGEVDKGVSGGQRMGAGLHSPQPAPWAPSTPAERRWQGQSPGSLSAMSSLSGAAPLFEPLLGELLGTAGVGETGDAEMSPSSYLRPLHSLQKPRQMHPLPKGKDRVRGLGEPLLVCLTPGRRNKESRGSGGLSPTTKVAFARAVGEKLPVLMGERRKDPSRVHGVGRASALP